MITEALTALIEAQQRAATHTPRTPHNRTVYIDGHAPIQIEASERPILMSLRIILMVNILLK